MRKNKTPTDLNPVETASYKPIEPTPVCNRLGFYHIPNFSRYAINHQGNVIVIDNEDEHITRVGSRLVLISDNQELVRVETERLIGLTFDHPGISTDDLVYQNGEWITKKEIKEQKVYLIRHIQSDTVYSIKQKTQAISIVGLTRSELFTRFNHCKEFGNDDKIWPEGWQYRIGRDNKPWRDFKDSESLLKAIENEYGNKNRIAVRFQSTGDVKIFDSQSEASKELGINSATLSEKLKLLNQPLVKTKAGYVQFSRDGFNPTFRELKDFYEEVRHADPTLRIVQSRNPDTKEVKTYVSAIDCAREENIDYKNLCYWLKNTKVRPNGRQYRYYSKSTEW